jgi:hypothetical protein
MWRSNCHVLLFFAAFLPEGRSSHTSKAHINPYNAHIIRMNVGGVVPLQQGDKDASGASSDEQSVTGGGALFRAVEFGRCQQIYVDSGNHKETLFLLCIVLNVNKGDTPLLSLENKPWSRLPKSSFWPKNTDFVKEIERRTNLYNVLPMPRPSNWKRPQVIHWLEQTWVSKKSCVEFLVSEVAKLKDILARLHQQETDLSTGGGGGAKKQGTVPYLCVIMCLANDQVKRLFLNQANVRTRHECDGQNSENKWVSLWGSGWCCPLFHEASI